MYRSLLLAAALLLATSPLDAADGDLDPTFDADGRAVVGGPGGRAGVRGVAIVPGGAVVGGGFTRLAGWPRFRLAAVRLTSAGLLDPTFGSGGATYISVSLDGAEADAYAYALARQSDGGLVLAGEAIPANGGSPRPIVARLTASGALDAGFGNAGVVELGFNGRLRAVMIDGDGRIVVGGSRLDADGTSFALARLNSDGSVDAAFAAAGYRFFRIYSAATNTGVMHLAAGTNGSLLAGGSFTAALATNLTFYTGVQQWAAITRLTPTGAFDSTFGDTTFGTGRVVYRIPCRLGGLVVDSSERPAMACTLTANSPVGWRFVRFYSGGNPQTTSTVYFPGGGEVTDLTRQSVDGRLLATGSVPVTLNGQTTIDVAVARVRADLSADPSFGFAGKRTIAFDLGAWNTDEGFSIAQSGTSVVVGGMSIVNGLEDKAMIFARLKTSFIIPLAGRVP